MPNQPHVEKFILKLPKRFSFFKESELSDFDTPLSFLKWSCNGDTLEIDLSDCQSANYQTLSLLVLYLWHHYCLGFRMNVIDSNIDTALASGASVMWTKMGAKNWLKIFNNEDINFKGNYLKPLFALRNSEDFSSIISRITEYTSEFKIEYEQTLRYILSELLYNTQEHGKAFVNGKTIPSLVQFNWYSRQNRLAFIIADLGIGIKKHLEQSYPGFETDSQAILSAIKPQITGTKNLQNPYTAKNNAGMGLFLTSNIIRNLKANMYIVSGKGLVHISPNDITSQELSNTWPGTFVYVTLQLSKERDINLEKMMSEFRTMALRELQNGNGNTDDIHYLSIRNQFGVDPVNKESAIWYRNDKLIPAIDEAKVIKIDFSGISSIPHSFLSALLATPIKKLGIQAYKRIKIINATPELRETIDYIFEENTI